MLHDSSLERRSFVAMRASWHRGLRRGRRDCSCELKPVCTSAEDLDNLRLLRPFRLLRISATLRGTLRRKPSERDHL